MRQINFRELELARLELGLNLLDKMQKSLFGLSIIGVAGHCDMPPRELLIHGGAEFAPVPQPLLQSMHRRTIPGAFLQLIEQRRDLRPLSQVDLRRHKSARRMRWQLAERQQIHATTLAGTMQKAIPVNAWCAIFTVAMRRTCS